MHFGRNRKPSELDPVLVLATQEVFEIMLGSRLEMASEPPPEDALEVTRMVGLAGLLCGVLTMRCSTRAAVRMAAKMLGTEAEKRGWEIWDALGEVCNMVAGNFKIKIPGWVTLPAFRADGDQRRNYKCHSSANASRCKRIFCLPKSGLSWLA